MTGKTEPLPHATGPALPAGRRVGWIGIAAGLVGIAILCGLGSWQIQRLHWKEALLATIDQRIHATPESLDAVAARAAASDDVDYRPVTMQGQYLNAYERYFLATYDGDAGWNVYTPFLTDDERLVFVNRGFVPYALRDPSRRPDSQIEGETVVTGLARSAPTQKPDWFLPDNDTAEGTFFWRSVGEMAKGVEVSAAAQILPFTVDTALGSDPKRLPIGGQTIIDLPNDHLQYAITWYGLALGLAGVLIAVWIKRRRASAP
ncbi:SURF1 family protein [Mangrovibrevibacter kandeliae]|uniref:SURF1 family protein n=1 Tax=Mangrovibrevibacter kandeliae TaxID=2968473 RepID=UPI002117E90E|nr:SURF1 family protein [Aurantimonas sp. CSK15Z-1]MCQ8780732.1 SURF1 family protein [Aurantimonas sp. CSK15Z-1]